jgi:enterochelin esterase family protein
MHHWLKFGIVPAVALCAAWAQQPQGPAVNSPEIASDRRVTLRLLAPKAAAVTLMASDIPDQPRGGAPLTRGANGVWEITLGPLEPGAYRYRFVVDGVPATDPRNPEASESNANSWSLFAVSGSEWMDAHNVPHGAVSKVHYYSSTLNRHRRMHVYTPPGYEAGKGRYPVFYLLHGAGDCDDSWTSVGRAGFILDNLIAKKKAVPMIVVMPAGHTSRSFTPGGGLTAAVKEFGQDFVKDVMPYVERNYRALTGRQHRAIAGLSMGGLQTLNISIAHLDKFSAIGVFSSGIFGAPRPGAAGAPPAVSGPPPEWEKENKAALENASLRKGLKLFWFATGKDDFLLKSTVSTVEMFKKYGFAPVYLETGGGHTWLKWRDYLIEFAPQLFK